MNQSIATPANGRMSRVRATVFAQVGSHDPESQGSTGAAERTSARLTMRRSEKTIPARAPARGALRLVRTRVWSGSVPARSIPRARQFPGLRSFGSSRKERIRAQGRAVNEGEDGAAPDELLDPGGHPGLVVDEVDPWQPDNRGDAICHPVLRRDRRPDDLLGRDAVDLLREGPDHLDAAAGNDARLEPDRAQVREELEHRLMDDLGVRASEARVPGLCEPVRGGRAELVRRLPGVGCHDEVEERPFARGGDALHVSREGGRERVRRLPLGVLRRKRPHAVERERELDVHRLFGPERPVVVEDGDPFGGRDERRGAGLRDALDEGDDGLPRGGVVPRGERVGAGAGNSEAREESEGRGEAAHGCLRPFGCLLDGRHRDPGSRAAPE